MTNLELDYDEGIILQTMSVERFGSCEESLEELILTNKSLICVWEKSTGFFKSETVSEKIPLSSIKVVNGKTQVMINNSDDYGLGIQILYNDGKRDHFVFYTKPKKEMPKWVDAINKTLNGEEIEKPSTVSVFDVPQKEKKQGGFLGGIADAINGFDMQGAVENTQAKMAGFSQQVADFSQQMTEKVQSRMEAAQTTEESVKTSCFIELEEIKEEKDIKEEKTMFCSNCGTKLSEGAKFCHGCGTPVGGSPVVPQQTVSNMGQQRTQEYVGKILKCSNCGAVITETTVICPDCGIQITGRGAVSSVQAFQEQLMRIELSRKKSKFMDVYTQSANPADTQKLSLIRSFPIPNTVDDIQEFMFLAMANIDVKLSKNTAGGKFNSWMNSGNVNLTIQKTISDAWVAKMQQAYQKAEISFANEPIFASIQKMYYDKLKELKISVK